MSKTKLFILAAFALIATVPAAAFENVDFTRAAEATVNGVVSIKSYTTPRTTTYQSINPFENDPFFDFFFGPSQRQQQPQRKQQETKPELRQSGLGSGVIISADGYIVTNNHVVSGAEKLEITLNDNRTFEAKVIGTDADTDLALIKIDADDLHVIPMGDSDNLKVGEWVLAVGNPFGLTSTVTAGIVSAKARSISGSVGSKANGIESYIQTDAAVNPGNSGGALVNLAGELVGINSAIYSQTGNYAGNSFAIPTSIVTKVVDDLKQYGSVQRAVLGITYGELTPELIKEKKVEGVVSGLYVHSVEPGSAASDAGIKEGDVIVSINNHITTNTGTLQAVMTRLRPGDVAQICVKRGGKPMQFDVTLRNARGNTEITHGTDVKSLGCSFKELTPDDLKQLNIKSGLEVVDVTEGKFRNAGIRTGLIILDINNVEVTTAAAVEKLYKSIVESKEYDHVMFITGMYPNTNRKVYYAVDLAD